MAVGLFVGVLIGCGFVIWDEQQPRYHFRDLSNCTREVGTDEQAAMEPGFTLEGKKAGGREWARYHCPKEK
jgi:hypothetical protein